MIQKIAVLDAKTRLISVHDRTQRKIAKAQLKSAKKDLKTGYKEYRAFEKDMLKKYGKTKNYTFDSNKNRYVNKQTKRMIEKFEYEGLQNYETFKRVKRMQIANGAAAAASAFIVTAGISLAELYNN